MKKLIILFISFVLGSCSTAGVYKGRYGGQEVTLDFLDRKKGYILMDNNSIPFHYKIEKVNIDKRGDGHQKKEKYFVYRFSVNAPHNIPFGLHSTAKKRPTVLYINDSVSLVRQ